VTISIRLDPETEAELRRLLVAQRMPLSDFVRDAIREKLPRSELPATP
jgi:predicted transcriptional regulator